MCWIVVGFWSALKMADLEAVLADVSYLMAMEKSKCTPAARASKKIILPDPRYVVGRYPRAYLPPFRTAQQISPLRYFYGRNARPQPHSQLALCLLWLLDQHVVYFNVICTAMRHHNNRNNEPVECIVAAVSNRRGEGECHFCLHNKSYITNCVKRYGA